VKPNQDRRRRCGHRQALEDQARQSDHGPTRTPGPLRIRAPRRSHEPRRADGRSAGAHLRNPEPYGVTDKFRAKRAAGLYQDDQAGLWRCSHDNPYIKQLGEKSQQLLHTSYHHRPEYKR